MKTLYPLFFLLLFIGLVRPASAQNFTETSEFLNANSHWVFGYHAGLDFNTGSAVSINSEIVSLEGSSTLSDPATGDLLFYSNGESVRQANGNIMPHGDSLLGNSNHSYNSYQWALNRLSTHQGTCIVPVIGESDKYYLFSLTPTSTIRVNYGDGSLFYSVIDMSLEGGLGDIIQGQKNIPLSYDTLAEAMIAVPGNNCDIWLLVHSFHRPEICAYRISEDGIDTTPVISNIGIPPTMPPYGTIIAPITLAISPDRQKIARRGGVFIPSIIANFDASSGQVSDVIQLPGNYYASSGLCFSPDNSKLYLADNSFGLGQFDISTYDSTAIVSSLTNIVAASSWGGGHLRLYNDTIYFINNLSHLDTSNIDPTRRYIHRISSPNLSGLTCDLQYNALSLLPGTGFTFGFGSDVVFPLQPDTLSALALDTTICPKAEVILAPTLIFDHIEWSDGSSDSILRVSQAGIYWMTQTDGCRYRVDTFIVNVSDFPEPVITVDVLELGTVSTYASYQWMFEGNIIPNATQSSYIVLENGDYQVIVTNSDGCVDTSEIYTVTNADGTSIDDINPQEHNISIYPNPATDILHVNAPFRLNIALIDLSGRVLKQVDNATEIFVGDIMEGVYFLKCYDQHDRLIRTEKVVIL